MISVRSNAAVLAQRNRARAKRLQREFPATMQGQAQALVKVAQSFSHGRFSSEYLRREARIRGAGLYSLRSPKPPADPGIINQQHADGFASSWKTLMTMSSGRSVIVLFNTSPHAKFLLGTRLMIHRPVLDRIEEHAHPAFFNRLRRMLQRVLAA